MRDFIRELLFAAIGVAVGILLMTILLQEAIVLPKDQWRCTEYLAGTANCASYTHLETSRE